MGTARSDHSRIARRFAMRVLERCAIVRGSLTIALRWTTTSTPIRAETNVTSPDTAKPFYRFLGVMILISPQRLVNTVALSHEIKSVLDASELDRMEKSGEEPQYVYLFEPERHASDWLSAFTTMLQDLAVNLREDDLTLTLEEGRTDAAWITSISLHHMEDD